MSSARPCFLKMPAFWPSSGDEGLADAARADRELEMVLRADGGRQQRQRNGQGCPRRQSNPAHPALPGCSGFAPAGGQASKSRGGVGNRFNPGIDDEPCCMPRVVASARRVATGPNGGRRTQLILPVSNLGNNASVRVTTKPFRARAHCRRMAMNNPKPKKAAVQPARRRVARWNVRSAMTTMVAMPAMAARRLMRVHFHC